MTRTGGIMTLGELARHINALLAREPSSAQVPVYLQGCDCTGSMAADPTDAFSFETDGEGAPILLLVPRGRMTRLVDSPHTLQEWRRELGRVFKLLTAGSLRDDAGRAARHVYLLRGGPYDGEHRVGAVMGPPVLRLPGPVAGGLMHGAADPGAYTDLFPVWEYTRAMWTSGTTRGRAFSVTVYAVYDL